MIWIRWKFTRNQNMFREICSGYAGIRSGDGIVVTTFHEPSVHPGKSGMWNPLFFGPIVGFLFSGVD